MTRGGNGGSMGPGGAYDLTLDGTHLNTPGGDIYNGSVPVAA